MEGISEIKRIASLMSNLPAIKKYLNLTVVSNSKRIHRRIFEFSFYYTSCCIFTIRKCQQNLAQLLRFMKLLIHN